MIQKGNHGTNKSLLQRFAPAIWEKSLTRGGELDIFKQDISESNSEEREVLFKKGSIFFVVARDGNMIYLEEI